MSYQNDSIIEFLKTLISIPSQAGINNQMEILEAVSSWFNKHDIKGKILFNRKKPVAFLCDIVTNKNYPTYCFNACLDTAPIGDINNWDSDPFVPKIDGNWLFGRGAADSKIAVSMFSHIANELTNNSTSLKSNLSFLFDCDEHTGSFGGIKKYLQEHKDTKGFFIGYPGNYVIVSGGRGFLRMEITFFGISQHTGDKNEAKENAIIKATKFIEKITALDLNQFTNKDFPLIPKITITKIDGGYNYTVVPDKCTVHVDIRLTPDFEYECANKTVKDIVNKVDEHFNSSKNAIIKTKDSWPAYYLQNDSYILNTFKDIASKQLGRVVDNKICGPSNIGNLLATHKIEAICGFGVTYKNFHAANECIDISSITNIYDTYRNLAISLS
ncbi:MAG: M20 family metallopeptidase [Chitinispirillales bacterium]|jgi:succinyl-diaminopimelate desuccinylase|nr:M20 family metallopeptidase [Chitinispirillales bacterium]